MSDVFDPSLCDRPTSRRLAAHALSLARAVAHRRVPPHVLPRAQTHVRLQGVGSQELYRPLQLHTSLHLTLHVHRGNLCPISFLLLQVLGLMLRTYNDADFSISEVPVINLYLSYVTITMVNLCRV